jgi:predicted transcriptional regulator
MFNPNLEKEKAKIAAKLLPELLESRRTKYEVASILGVSERTAREYISNTAKKIPILAHSQAVGYKKFNDDADIENAIATVMESRSRRKELMEREKPLLKALKQRGIQL